MKGTVCKIMQKVVLNTGVHSKLQKTVLEKRILQTFLPFTRESTKLNLEEGNCKTWFSDGKTKTEIVFLAGVSTGLKPTSRGVTGWVCQMEHTTWIHQDAHYS